MIINNFNNVGYYNPVNSSAAPAAKSGFVKQSPIFGKDNGVVGKNNFGGRFDVFVNEANKKATDSLMGNVFNALDAILHMSQAERRQVAAENKDNMKKLSSDAIKHEQEELEKFKDLKEQKAYYESIKKDSGYIAEGKYAFAGKSKTWVPGKELDEIIAGVQQKIDDLVTAKNAKESDPLDSKTFEYLYCAAAFAAATYMRGGINALRVNDSSISGQWSRTEENFEEASANTVENLKNRIKEIDDMYRDYLKRDKFDGPPEDDRLNHGDMTSLMNTFENWEKKVLLRLMEYKDVSAEEMEERISQLWDGLRTE